MSDHSYNDAEASKLIIAIFSIVTIASDIIIFFILHYVSRQIPKPNQYDHNNQKQSCLFGRIYPSFYFIDTSTIKPNDDDSYDDDEKQQEKIPLIIQKNKAYFGENEISIWSKLLRHRTITEYFVLSLQFWSLCCGFIALYLSLVFYMNMIVEYIISCISHGWSFYLLALFALFFLIEIIFWSIRRQLESLQIICRNAMDIYHIRFITIWRLFNILSCVAFSIWVAVDDNFIPFSDILWWQFFLFFMVIRGILFQILYTFITFIESMIMIIHKLKICCGRKQKINICQLIFVIDSSADNIDCDRGMFQCSTLIQCAFIIAVFVYVAVFTLIYIVNNDELFRFAAGCGVLYYIIVVFERGKYNALYMLWSTRFHNEYFQRLIAVEDNKVVNNVLLMEISEPSVAENKKKIHHQQNTAGTMLIKNDSDLPLLKAVQYDIDELMLEKIKFVQFWSKIKYDYKRNDYFGCNKYCHCAQDWLGWCFIIIYIIALILTVYLYLIQSNETTQEIFDNSEHVSSSSYPICDFKLTDNNYLSVMDLTYLSIVAYHSSSKAQITQQFADWFGHNYTEYGWDINTLSTHKNPSFFHIYNEEFNFDIIAVRGTMDKSDTEQDIGLWTEIATFEMFSWLIPLTDVLPMGFIRQFINLASMPERLITPSVRDNYDNPIYDYIENNIINVANDSDIICVGHSLGGSIAQVVAARLYDDGYGDDNNIISFGISNAGTLYSSKKLGFSVESLDKTAISLLPRRDIITMVDVHGGVVQNIECNAKQVFSCHSSQTTFCEMYKQCSNHLTRNVSFANCVCIDKNHWSKCL